MRTRDGPAFVTTESFRGLHGRRAHHGKPILSYLERAQLERLTFEDGGEASRHVDALNSSKVLASASFLRDVVMPEIAAGAKRAGRSASDIQLFAQVLAAMGDMHAEQDRSLGEARRQICFYGST